MAYLAARSARPVVPDEQCVDSGPVREPQEKRHHVVEAVEVDVLAQTDKVAKHGLDGVHLPTPVPTRGVAGVDADVGPDVEQHIRGTELSVDPRYGLGFL